MAIIVSIIFIVAYCIFDRQRTNERKRVMEINDRISGLDKRVVSCEKFIESEMSIGGKQEDACSPAPLPGQSNDSNG